MSKEVAPVSTPAMIRPAVGVPSLEVRPKIRGNSPSRATASGMAASATLEVTFTITPALRSRN